MISMERNDRIAFRTNKELKEQATAILAKSQLDLSTALNLFLGKVVEEKTLPFDFKTAEQKAAEWAMIEKHLDKAIERRKNGKKGYTEKELEAILDKNLELMVAEQSPEYKIK